MKKAIWLGVVIAGVSALLAVGAAWAQDKKADDKAAAPAAAEKVAPGVEVAKEGGAGHHGGDSMDFITIITRSGWFGIFIWVLLIAASILSVWLVIDSFITIREPKISPASLVTKVREAMEQGDLVKAIQYCDETPVPLARILKAGFMNVQDGFEVVQDAVSVAADLESEKMLQRVTYLSVISNTTPMLGLIGTVQGMIYAFFTLGTQQAGAAQQAMLAVNISHGLWATAIGLGTAVPATIFFYFFKNLATRLILNMEAKTLELIKSLRNVEVVEG